VIALTKSVRRARAQTFLRNLNLRADFVLLCCKTRDPICCGNAYRAELPVDAPTLGGVEPGRALMTYWALGGREMAGIEYLTNVGQMPTGAYFLFAAVKVRGGHGGHGRAIALD
jgi:hypothetical protein